MLFAKLRNIEAIVQFAKDMIEEGILAKAEEETTIRIGEFVSNVSGKRVNVEYEPRSAELILPSSCEPENPSGWERDEEDGRWRRAE